MIPPTFPNFSAPFLNFEVLEVWISMQPRISNEKPDFLMKSRVFKISKEFKEQSG